MVPWARKRAGPTCRAAASNALMNSRPMIFRFLSGETTTGYPDMIQGSTVIGEIDATTDLFNHGMTNNSTGISKASQSIPVNNLGSTG